MTRRRKLLITLGLLQLGLWFLSWSPYIIDSIKFEELRVSRTVESAVAALERERWLVDREDNNDPSLVYGLIYDPVSRAIYRTRETAWLPIVSLGWMGLIFLVLGLIPDRWPEGRQAAVSNGPASV